MWKKDNSFSLTKGTPLPIDHGDGRVWDSGVAIKISIIKDNAEGHHLRWKSNCPLV